MAESRPFASLGRPSPRQPGVQRWAARLVLLLPVLLAVAAGLLFAASLLPTSLLQSRLGAGRADGGAGAFTVALFQHLAERLRLAGAVLAVAGLALVAGRGQAVVLVGDALAAAPRFRADLAHGARAVRGESATHLVALAAIAVGAVALRLAFLGQPIRYDEALTFTEFASRPLYYALSYYPDPNNQLLHTLLVHVAWSLFGDAPWAIRLPAFLAGILVVPATYVVARLLYGRDAALLAAALVAASSSLVEYSTNARGYSLLTLWFLVALALAAYVAVTGNRLAAVALAVAAALGFYTIPTMLYAFAVVLVWLAWALLRSSLNPSRSHASGRPRAAAVLTLAGLLGATALLTFLLYLPPIIVSGPENLLSNRFVTPLDATSFATDLPRSLRSTWALWTRDLPAPVVVLLVLGFAGALVRHRALGYGGMPVALAAPVACLPLLLVQRVVPFERVWLFLLPVFLTTASAGLVAAARPLLRPRRPSGLLDVVAVGVAATLGALVLANGSVPTSAETGSFPDAEGVTLLLRDRLRGSDSVVTTAPASLPQLQYEFRRYGMDPAALVRDPASSDRVYLVTAPAGDVAPLAGAGWAAPRRLAAFRSATVYEVSRSSPPSGR